MVYPFRGIFIRKQGKLKSSSNKGFQLSYFREEVIKILSEMFASEGSIFCLVAKDATCVVHWIYQKTGGYR